jgi:Asp-tRNA(Asn)/Glu-tRNA(Gln) amidotransferase A subunit family amidase
VDPWNLASNSGGSSSGPAAATSAGLVPFAIGTETMGSLLDPASICQVTALRTSFGRVSRAGAMNLAYSFDRIGAICRTVEDSAIVMNAIRGADPADPCSVNASFNFNANQGLSGLKVGYEPGSVNPTMLNTITALGGTLVPIKFPSYPVGAMLSIEAVEGAASFDGLTRSGGLDLLNENGLFDLPNYFRTARTITAVDYLQADRVRNKMMQDVDSLFDQVDLWVRVHALDQNLALQSLLGLPAVGIPHGNGTSLVFVGRLYEEAVLLEAARAYQNVTGYQLARPPAFNQ